LEKPRALPYSSIGLFEGILKFSQSIAKLGQPLTYRRAWRRARRVLHPVPIRPLLAKIDQDRLRTLQARSGVISSDSPNLWRHYSKYLDVRKHLQLNIRRAQDLNLHRLPPQEILDIGCGGGFFLFVSQALGHHGLGLDVGGIPLFDDLVDLLAINRLECKVRGLEPLPDLGRSFDLITAFATAFHGGREDSWRWGEQEWDYFLTNLKRLLNPGGRIFFDLNAAYEGEYHTPEILDVLLRHGAMIERSNVLFIPET
jgi:SAM-dependent methyltransferase